jgi:hypothetical protein
LLLSCRTCPADDAAPDQDTSSDEEEEARPVRKKAARAGTAAAGKQLKTQPSKGRKPDQHRAGASKPTRKTMKQPKHDTGVV